jgi:CheY-like chemotaxis protein
VELGAWFAAHGAALAPAVIDPVSGPRTVRAHPDTLEKVLTSLGAGRAGVRIGLEREEIHEELEGTTLAAGTYIAIRLAAETAAEPPPGFDAFLAAREAAQAYLAVRAWGGDIVRTPGLTSVYLRPGAEPAPEAAPAATPEPAQESAPERETILLVEDEGGIRALVRKILKREGYQVLEAASGEEAVRIGLSHIGRIDLLLSDVTLPGISGREIADRLRPSMPHLKTLFISGFSEDRSVYGPEPAAGAAFLQKPFTLGALLSKVRGVIEGK